MHPTTGRDAASARSRIWAIIARSGSISRAEIARCSSLSKSRISLITRDLLERGLIREGVPLGRHGRPAVPLELNPDLALFYGISLHCQPMQAVIVDFSGKVRAELCCVRPSDPQDAADAVNWAFRELTGRLGVEPAAILGCGVSLPAHISADGTLCLRSTVLNWENVAFQSLLEQHLGIPVALENDLSCLLILMSGRTGRRGASHSLVAFGDGIGSAHMIDGRLLRGATGGAGEFAHLRAGPVASMARDRACRCGNTGCLETVASLPAILDSAHRQGRAAELDGLSRSAEQGDPVAAAILGHAAEAAGAGIASIVQILDPETVIAVLPQALVQGVFASALRRAVDRHVMPIHAGQGRLVVQTADARDWATGAAHVALRLLMRGALSGVTGGTRLIGGELDV